LGKTGLEISKVIWSFSIRKPLTLKNHLISAQNCHYFHATSSIIRKAQSIRWKRKLLVHQARLNLSAKNSIIIIFGHPIKLRNQDMKKQNCWKIGKISIKNEKLTRFVEKAFMRQFFLTWDFIESFFRSELIWAIYFWVSFSNKKFLGNFASPGKLMKITKWKKWLMKFYKKKLTRRFIDWLALVIQQKKLWNIGGSITANIFLWCYLWTISKFLELFAQISKKWRKPSLGWLASVFSPDINRLMDINLASW
jgi:hypothetical protein